MNGLTNKQYRARYVNYLRTPYWAAKRQAAIACYGGACSKCGSRNRLEVRHLRYDNLGHEPMEDLALLCNSCHADLHGHKHKRVRRARPKPKRKRRTPKVPHMPKTRRAELVKAERRRQGRSSFTAAELKMLEDMRKR